MKLWRNRIIFLLLVLLLCTLLFFLYTKTVDYEVNKRWLKDTLVNSTEGADMTEGAIPFAIAFKKETIDPNKDKRLSAKEYGIPSTNSFHPDIFSLEAPEYKNENIQVWFTGDQAREVSIVSKINKKTQELQTWEFSEKVGVDRIFYIPESDEVVVLPYVEPRFSLKEGNTQSLKLKKIDTFLVSEFENEYLILSYLPKHFDNEYYTPKLLKKETFSHVLKLPQQWKEHYDLLEFSPSGRYAYYIGSAFYIDKSRDDEVFYVFDLKEDKILDFTHLIKQVEYANGGLWSNSHTLAYYHPSESAGEKYHFGCEGNVARVSTINLETGKINDIYTKKAKIVDLMTWSSDNKKIYFSEWDCHAQVEELKEINILTKEEKSIFKP